MVYHVMRDGSIRTDLTGYVLKQDENPGIYDVISSVCVHKVEREKEVHKESK